MHDARDFVAPSAPFAPRPFGATGIRVGPLGLGSSFGVGGADIGRAFDRGVNFFLWGSMRRRGFGLGLRDVARAHRGELAIAIQSYTRIASLMRFSVERALRFLRTDYVDVLCLAWWNSPPPPRIVDAALRLRDAGKVRHLMVSSHHRPSFEAMANDPAFDAIMVRYNAAHPGAEREVFPKLARRVGVVSFTATRWGALLNPRLIPEGERVPTSADCYRFALTNASVDVCLAGPNGGAQLDEAMRAIELGPMDDAELAWMRRVGAHVRRRSQTSANSLAMGFFDRVATSLRCSPHKLPPAA
jgi:aryl-alcohol dehydrogenase-like predicted oxidoreductase